jgi:hypothetical protein
MPRKAWLPGALAVLCGLVPATAARADLHSPGNQLWQQGAGDLADAPNGTLRVPLAGAGVYRTRGDAFGEAVATGDFNGDGFKDVAIGAPDEDAPTDNVEENTPYDEVDPGNGSVTIIYGSAAGGLGPAARASQFFTPATDGVAQTHADATGSQEFGSALAAGDFNGDGADDLAIGVPGRHGGVVVLPSTGRTKPDPGLTTNGARFWSQDSNGILGASEHNDRFGASLAAAKFNADGYADLAIGVPGEDDEAGAVNVIYGSDGGLRASGNQLWDQNSDGIEGGAEGIGDYCSGGPFCDVRGDGFGWSLAAGDFDNDRRADLAVGVPYERTDYHDAGAVAVLYSNYYGLSGRDQFFEQGSDSDDVEGEGATEELFGWSLAAGRFSNYGGDSLAIGVPGDDNGSGAVNVIYSAPGGLNAKDVIADRRWTQNTPGIEGGAEDGDAFGKSVAAGAFRGGSLDALAIGVPGEDESAGAVAVIYPDNGVISMLQAAGNQLWQQGTAQIQGAAEGNDQLGSALATGDLDGNGAEDLIAGARFEDNHAGAINAIYSARPGVRDVTPPIITETVTGQRNSEGVYVGDVVVTFTVKDPESTVLSTWMCEPATITTSGTRSVTCGARSEGGTATRTVTIRHV